MLPSDHLELLDAWDPKHANLLVVPSGGVALTWTHRGTRSVRHERGWRTAITCVGPLALAIAARYCASPLKPQSSGRVKHTEGNL